MVGGRTTPSVTIPHSGSNCPNMTCQAQTPAHQLLSQLCGLLLWCPVSLANCSPNIFILRACCQVVLQVHLLDLLHKALYVQPLTAWAPHTLTQAHKCENNCWAPMHMRSWPEQWQKWAKGTESGDVRGTLNGHVHYKRTFPFRKWMRVFTYMLGSHPHKAGQQPSAHTTMT